MKNLGDSKSVVRKVVFERDDLREIYCREFQTQRRAHLKLEEIEDEVNNDREARRQALFARLGYQPKPDRDPRLLMSPAEAWMEDHPEEVTSETAPTRGALQQVITMERLRFKAADRRLREMGVK